MAMTQIVQDDEISLVDVWRAAKRYKKLLLLTSGLGAVAAYVFVTFVVAPTWLAEGVMQVGQVGQVTQVTQMTQVAQVAQVVLVEPVQHVVSRMKQPSFAVKMLAKSDLDAEARSRAERLYKSTLEVTKVKDSALINFSVRGYSAEMAQSLAEGTVGYIQKLHETMMEPAVTRIKAQIQAADADLISLRKDVNFLERQLQGNHNWNSYNATLAATVLQEKSDQLRRLTQTKLLLEEQLSPRVTFTTKLLGDLTISEGPVSPKKLLIIGLATLLGLLGGIVIAFVHNVIGKDVE